LTDAVQPFSETVAAELIHSLIPEMARPSTLAADVEILGEAAAVPIVSGRRLR